MSDTSPPLTCCKFGQHREGQHPLLFIHGVGLNQECWFLQAKALASTHHIYTLDLPGHGDTPFSDRIRLSTLSDYGAEVTRLCAEVIGRPAIVIGHSLGALLALDMAGRHPELCAGLMPVSAIYRRSESATRAVSERAARLRTTTSQSDRDTIIRAPLRRWFGPDPRGAEKEMAMRCRNWLTAADPRGYAAAYSLFARETGPDDALLARLGMPLFFLTGAEDPNSTPEMSHAMAKLCPQAQAQIIPGARHMLQLTHAADVTEIIDGFARRCNSKPARTHTLDK